MKFSSSSPSPADAVATAATERAELQDRPIGSILAEHHPITSDQIETVLAYQRAHGLKFGEAAVTLGLVSSEDVLWALAQQFHYPYAPGADGDLSPELIVATKPFSRQAESFRAIRSQVMMRFFNDPAATGRALAFISPDSGDGKTFFVANLAVACAQLGGRTLVVDADLRNPRQHQMFGISNEVGLSGILSGRVSSQVICALPSLGSLFVLPSGTVPPNPLELVERPAFALLLRELQAKFDYVLVDTPAAIYGADASVIASKCGAAMAIARQDKSRVKALNQLVGTLAGTPTKMLGALINQR